QKCRRSEANAYDTSPVTSQRSTTFFSVSVSLEPVFVLELLRDVLRRNEADALREEGIDLHLEAVIENPLYLALPFFVGEPLVRHHLFGARDVLLIELDLDGRGELELLVVVRAHPEKTHAGNGEPHRFVR